MILRVIQKSYYLLLIVSIAFVITDAKAQNEYPNKLIENGKLKWEDFSGPVDPNSKYSATTHWLINYKYKVLPARGDTVTVDLQVTTFLKGNSWVLPNKKSDELLEHEQGHFNVALIHSLKFKKAIMATTLLKSNYAETVNSIFKSIMSEANQMDLQYDEETNHALNRLEQKRWNQKFNSMLINP